MGFTPYSFYMFNRHGECLQYIEWSRPRKVKNSTDDQKMTFGMLFSLNQFVAKMDPQQPSAAAGADASSLAGIRKVGFHSFRTNTYKLTFFETQTGLKLVLTTDPAAGASPAPLLNRFSHTKLLAALKSRLEEMKRLASTSERSNSRRKRSLPRAESVVPCCGRGPAGGAEAHLLGALRRASSQEPAARAWQAIHERGVRDCGDAMARQTNQRILMNESGGQQSTIGADQQQRTRS